MESGASSKIDIASLKQASRSGLCRSARRLGQDPSGNFSPSCSSKAVAASWMASACSSLGRRNPDRPTQRTGGVADNKLYCRRTRSAVSGVAGRSPGRFARCCSVGPAVEARRLAGPAETVTVGNRRIDGWATGEPSTELASHAVELLTLFVLRFGSVNFAGPFSSRALRGEQADDRVQALIRSMVAVS